MEKTTVIEAARQLFVEAPAPGPSRSDVGAVPVAHNGCSDTCAAYEDDDVRSKGRKAL